MTTYSVADAKTQLLQLVDRSLAGEEIVIARHDGQAIVLKPATSSADRKGASAAYAWLKARRDARPLAMRASVQLLNEIYDGPIDG